VILERPLYPFSYPTAISFPFDEKAKDRVAGRGDNGTKGVVKNVIDDILSAFQNLFKNRVSFSNKKKF
jgi:hypothetical protein